MKREGTFITKQWTVLKHATLHGTFHTEYEQHQLTLYIIGLFYKRHEVP